jgi:hypothetical protein
MRLAKKSKTVASSQVSRKKRNLALQVVLKRRHV